MQNTKDAAITENSAPTRLIEADKFAFRQNFNKAPFPIRHRLHDDPLFEVTRLIELAAALEERPGEVYGDTDVQRIGQRWDETPRPPLKISEVLKNIQEAKAWIFLRRAELDPQYRALLNRCMGELKEISGIDWHRQMRVQNAIVFITSPRRLTTYHIDRECNFILQVRGEKTVYIFDQNDREVLPEQELESFWAADNNAAIYKPQYQNRAKAFHLGPGDGVHVPVNAPHWVQNGADVSITLSVNFQFKDIYRANNYRANYYLRKLGVTPTAPGHAPFRDSLKAYAVGAAALLARPLKSIRAKME